MNDQAKRARMMTGTVVSQKADKTIVVKVERRVKHPLYKKYMTRSTKIHAHDEGNSCHEGDVVAIVESRPISKMKRWRLDRIVEQGNK